MNGGRPKISPPLPAPYLVGQPQLPDELLAAMDERDELTPEEEAHVQRLMVQCKDCVLAARLAFQDAHNVEIEPEAVLIN